MPLKETSTAPCKVACVQLWPAAGQVAENVDKVLRLTSRIEPGSVDLVLLPEMALTGYIFADADAISTLLEDPYQDDGAASPSLRCARQIAIRLRCHVIIGFPMKTSLGNTQAISVATEPFDARQADLVAQQDVAQGSKGSYNAAMLVDESGQLLHVFRKHFSFVDDKRWAQEGPGFESLVLPRLGKVCVAICMDLNAYDFQAPHEAFELARYCQREKVDKLLMIMAWLLPWTAEDGDELDQTPSTNEQDTLSEPADAQTINWWATRMTPFLEEDAQRDFHFIACNRTGTELGSKFAGSSCVLHFSEEYRDRSDGKGAGVACLGAMDRREGVYVFEL